MKIGQSLKEQTWHGRGVVRLLISGLFSCIALLVFSLPTLAAPLDTSNTNWAGYLTAENGGYQEVQMSWVVPCIDTQVTPQGAYAIWAGLGGSGNPNLVQAGTIGEADSTLLGSKLSYYAFMENTGQANDPGSQHVFSVTCGDTMFASISTINGTSSITLKDEAHRVVKASYTTTTSPAASTASAECILERPSYGPSGSSNRPALADFSSASMTNCSVTPISGATYPIAEEAAVQTEVLVGNDQTTPLVSVGSLDSYGDFTVTWKASQ